MNLFIFRFELIEIYRNKRMLFAIGAISALIIFSIIHGQYLLTQYEQNNIEVEKYNRKLLESGKSLWKAPRRWIHSREISNLAFIGIGNVSIQNDKAIMPDPASGKRMTFYKGHVESVFGTQTVDLSFITKFLISLISIVAGVIVIEDKKRQGISPDLNTYLRSQLLI